jgi:hypothetical protein
VRFTVLASRLLRLEHSPGGDFEDRPSQVFWYRDQPVPRFTAQVTESAVEIETEHLRLHYRITPGGFRRSTLSIRLKESGATWRHGMRPRGNLGGTARTLDAVAGKTPLKPGLVSRQGWAVVDDSQTLVFDEAGYNSLITALEKKEPADDWGLSRKSVGFSSRRRGVYHTQKLTPPGPEPMALHMFSKMLMLAATDGKAPAWLAEGFTAYCENLMTKRNLCYSFSYEKNDVKFGENWNQEIRKYAMQGKLKTWDTISFHDLRAGARHMNAGSEKVLVGCVRRTH